MTDRSPAQSFLARHEFLIRRLHSLCGLVPVGAFMVVHLTVNASVLGGAQLFQSNVDRIHSLGPLLPVVEWAFIFLPLLFHAIFGVVIIAGGVPNTGDYPHISNIRYTLQRATGIVAFFFIVFHVMHMHHYGESLGWGGQFKPDYATSSAGAAMKSIVIKVAYMIGMLSCVYHLANGLWTMGITWGLWTSPAGQRRANFICVGLGIALAVIGLSTMSELGDVDVEKTRKVEERLYKAREHLQGRGEQAPPADEE